MLRTLTPTLSQRERGQDFGSIPAVTGAVILVIVIVIVLIAFAIFFMIVIVARVIRLGPPTPRSQLRNQPSSRS